MPTCSPPENALGTEARQRVTTMNHEPSSSETSLESEPPSRSAQKDASVDEAGVAALEFVPSSLRTAITQRGFQSLTSVQVAALERAGTDSDLRISSQTGSGKTVAIGLAVSPVLLQRAIDATDPRGRFGPYVLIVVPTRELAAQVSEELSWLFAAIRAIRCECVTGGTSVWRERQVLSTKPMIVVGTPGRMLDHIQANALDVSLVEHLVLDEADQMLDLGFRDELEAILEAASPERRTHLVSATFPREVQNLADRYQTNALHIQGTRLGEANKDIEHLAYPTRLDDRYKVLVNLLLLNHRRRALIFVKTRAEASELSERLANDGFAALCLSGELQQSERTRTLNAFRNGTTRVLVATDVAARGLDVPDVSTVIHTSAPRDIEVYTHRSGRTGRAGRKGRSILLAQHYKLKNVERMLRAAKIQIEWREVPNRRDVHATLFARDQEELRNEIDARLASDDAEGDSRWIESARKLLDGRNPEIVVAELLERCRPKLPREPFELDFGGRRDRNDRRVDQRRERREYAPRIPFDSDDSDRRSQNGRGGPSQRPSHRGFRDKGFRGSERRDGSYDRFFTNYGERRGANPKRVLAMVCRRGGVTSREIGAIIVGPNGSLFDVSKAVASAFESKARQRDERDPSLRIERAKFTPPKGQGREGGFRGDGPPRREDRRFPPRKNRGKHGPPRNDRD